MAIMMGTRNWPPHALSGRLVAEPFGPEKNIHSDTKRSAIIFAYDVSTSARSMSPNFPCPACANPPTETRFSIERKRRRPEEENRERGRRNIARSRTR